MTHTGHYSDNGILMSDNMTYYEERTTVNCGSNNELSNTSKAEESTSHYIKVEVSTIHPRGAPPTDDICGDLNTVVTRH